MQNSTVHDIFCFPIGSQRKQATTTSNPGGGHIELSMGKARLLQLKSSNLETLSWKMLQINLKSILMLPVMNYLETC